MCGWYFQYSNIDFRGGGNPTVWGKLLGNKVVPTHRIKKCTSSNPYFTRVFLIEMILLYHPMDAPGLTTVSMVAVTRCVWVMRDSINLN